MPSLTTQTRLIRKRKRGHNKTNLKKNQKRILKNLEILAKASEKRAEAKG